MEAHGALIWLKQPMREAQQETQPAATAEAEGQRETRMNSRQRRNAERLRVFQAMKRAEMEPTGDQMEPQGQQAAGRPDAGGAAAVVEEDANRALETASETEVTRSGSTAMVAAPDVNNTTGAMEAEAAERMDMCNSEPSESGEIPREELTAEERQELRGRKRAREDSAREAALAAMHVSLLIAELRAKGLSTDGKKRAMVARLMMAERGGDGEGARPCMYAQEP